MKQNPYINGQVDHLLDQVVDLLPDSPDLNLDDLTEGLRSRFQAILAERRSVWTPPELAQEWGVSPDKILDWIRSGELPAMNLAATQNGRPRYRIDQDGIDTFKRRRANHSPTPKQTRKRKPPADVIEFF
ncbi:MAG: helix-turn-helix domain-containing protein [Planctomycetaceae bacterium]|nr:helix-turn-helix domain-containing protein [Planctomycetaceae bacterium]MCB9952151.1 helix-turn-helix domain-containing protein [Planctomycetaceae bacterium]